jgi:hypothetical protein
LAGALASFTFCKFILGGFFAGARFVFDVAMAGKLFVRERNENVTLV